MHISSPRIDSIQKYANTLSTNTQMKQQQMGSKTMKFQNPDINTDYQQHPFTFSQQITILLLLIYHLQLMIPDLDITHHEEKKLQGFKRSKLSFNKTIKDEGSKIQVKHQRKDHYNVDYISPWEANDLNLNPRGFNRLFSQQDQKQKAQKCQAQKKSQTQKQQSKTNEQSSKLAAPKVLKRVEYSDKEKKSIIETIIRQNRIQTEPNKQISIDTGFGPLRYEKIKVPDSIRSGKPSFQRPVKTSQKKFCQNMKMAQIDKFKQIFSKKKKSKTGASIIDMNETTDQFQKIKLHLFNQKRTSFQQYPQKKKMPVISQHSTLYIKEPILKMENINQARLDKDLDRIEKHSILVYDQNKAKTIKDRRIMSNTKKKPSLCLHHPIQSNIKIK